MKRFLALALVLVMSLGLFAGCGSEKQPADDAQAASDLAYVQGKGKLIVGITDYAPMDYKDENDEWTGFDAEFARLFAEKIGVEAEFIEIDWDSKLMELDAKSIDCVWNGMTITPEIELGAAVGNAYVKNAQVVVMAKDKLASYADITAAKDLTFAVEAGSAGETAANENGLKSVAVGTQTAALMEVQSGAADACIIDITMANAMTGEGTSYADFGYSIELSTEEYGVAFRKGSDMVDKFNTVMEELKADGTLQNLAEKYELTLA